MGSRFDYEAWERTVNARQAQREREAAEKAREDAERREEWRRANEAAIAREDAKRAAKRAEIEAGIREKREAEVARARTNVEHDLRLRGAAEADVERLADAAMDAWHVEQAKQAAGRGDGLVEEIRAALRRRGSPAWVPGAE